MATADVMLPTEPTKLYYFLEVKDGGIIQTYPGTAFEKRRKHVPYDMNIKDMRPIKGQFSLHKNGFQLCRNPVKVADEVWSNQEQVEKDFYPSCEALIKKV